MDGTLGGGGHSREIAGRLQDGGALYCIDRDEDAIRAAGERLGEYKDRIRIIKDNYCNMKAALEREGVRYVDGILLDLGVSSYQLDTADRGFSYMKDAPLDMRMDRSASVSAAEVVNTYTREELVRILRDFGEEPFAKNIAARIVEEREKAAIETTGALSDIIKSAIPMKIQKTLGHPAKKSFQAIRIEVNSELSSLSAALEEMPGMLNSGGRICIITFHSLEDRIVKNAFRSWEKPCICPPQLPVCVCGKKSLGKVITKKPLTPSEDEMRENSRSQSAKLRVFEKVST